MISISSSQVVNTVLSHPTEERSAPKDALLDNWTGFADGNLVKANLTNEKSVLLSSCPLPSRPDFLSRFQPFADTGLIQFFIGQNFIYRRIGFDERLMTFDQHGRVVRGAAGCEVFWNLTEVAGLIKLQLCSQDKITCEFREDIDGIWRGRWLAYERMLVELVPTQPSDRIFHLDAEAGQSDPVTMKISICTSCSNRLYQFRQTFASSLAVISRYTDVEWIILNYNSKDQLHEFMMERLPTLPSRVLYARESADRPWHMSIAKNIAHRLGTGDYLLNLDCDNYLGDTVDMVRDPVARGVWAIHLGSREGDNDGTCGRVAIKREIFRKFGGYDESFFPAAQQEIDLLRRIRKAGFGVEHCPCAPRSAIKNSKPETIKHCQLAQGMSWDECDRRNAQKSKNNILNGKLVANEGVEWGRAEGRLELYRGNQ